MTPQLNATLDGQMVKTKVQAHAPVDWGHAIRRLAGIGLFVGGLGVWIAPHAFSDIDLLPMKLGLSLFLILGGMMLVRVSDVSAKTEAYIDIVRREVRVVLQSKDGKKTIALTPFQDLGAAQVDGDVLRLSAADGSTIVETSVTDPAIRSSLYGALQDAGKL